MRLSEIMTAGVVTATPGTSAVAVAQLMRGHRVGPVVIADPQGSPVAMVTDRDLTLRVFAAGVAPEMSVGIVTLDDIAVRSGDLEVAQKMTQDVIEGALPQFYFHERG